MINLLNIKIKIYQVCYETFYKESLRDLWSYEKECQSIDKNRRYDQHRSDFGWHYCVFKDKEKSSRQKENR